MTGESWVQQDLFGPEPLPDPLLCWLWLACTLGPASPRAGRVLDWCGGDPCRAWEARATTDFRQAAGAGAARRAVSPGNTPEAFRPVLDRCRALGVEVIPFDHPDYPLALTRIPDMPLVLYCTGDPAWLNAPALVGMVGSRRPDLYGQQTAENLGRALARAGAVIVSGLADGLDSECHRAAVAEHAPTIGVQGVPIDRTYPASNRALREKIEANGCVVGEYPPGLDGIGRNGFLQRNRLIAGLARALVVVQARERSGTMSTVAHAERYGRPVWALPADVGREDSAGSNRLIQSGRARMVLTAEDMLEPLGLSAAAPALAVQAPPLTDAERKVLACAGGEAVSLEELAARCGMQAAALAPVLMRLELSGRVKMLPGQRYIFL